MRPIDAERAAQLSVSLDQFTATIRPLPGIAFAKSKNAFIEQVIESIRRVRFPSMVAAREISPQRIDPRSELFDPIRAAILRQQAGETDEAAWLVFQSVHFGKHRSTGWRLLKDFYRRLDQGVPWQWATVVANQASLRAWLTSNENVLRGSDGVARHFGNHRKYETLSSTSPRGPFAVIKSYIDWVQPSRGHTGLFQWAASKCGGHSQSMFGILFQSMNTVASFGRTARFDYLCMLGKTRVAAVEPNSAYLRGSTGPLAGARLLFCGSGAATIPTDDLETSSQALSAILGVNLQVIEDALCNWQKSPHEFKRFRG